ncbi:cysteine hydrolase [Massilia pinisoli]|uniref:Cysteine hydrolase n=1 Tax=Massilia pinisoli TaxID=1772194 RepID=A0ABT1ZW32_9BURK|nr:cysteine hydrolase family protein [Massilia pinisoli]MCS0584137.1 cysteine hydrolase [Massilia pinisoli]
MHTFANAALVVIDVQQGFLDPRWGRRNNPDAERHIAALLAAWRSAGRPLFHVQHGSRSREGAFYPGTPGHAFKPEAMPVAGETIVRKDVNSAFIGTDLEARLRAADITTVVLCGLTTDHCVSTTARMAANLGFHIFLVEDACATHERTGPDGTYFSAEQMHATAIASLHGEFACVTTTAGVPGVQSMQDE